MTHTERTLLELWHGTLHPCVQLQLPAALPVLVRIVSRALPLAGLSWLIPEPGRRQLHGWYCGSADDAQPRALRLQDCDHEVLSSLSAWCASATIEVLDDGQRLRWLAALPSLGHACPEVESSATGLVALGLSGSQGARTLLLLHLPVHANPGEQHDFYAGMASCLSAWLDVLTLRSELAGLHEVIRQLRDRGSPSVPEPIVGAQGGLRLVLERVRMVAATDVPVLILGETGSGKEVIARALHQGSPRAGEAFVRVNCGALPPELIDSELFGHEKGAFTGASAIRRGWFEQADRGTLFLDEIGELPLPAQVRLLRVLQDGSLNRVGSETGLHVDVRVVAATHRDLPAMVLAGRFREDLWYRLATFPVLLPPLRERRADIAELATHFARRAAHRFGFPVVQPTEADVARLAAYEWPGNVREFAAVIDRALLLGEGRALDVATALGSPRVPTVQAASDTQAPPEDRPAALMLPTLEDVMRTHIAQALERTGGRLEGPHGAARLLAINPHTLRARMRKLGLDPAQFRSRPQYLQSGPR